MKKFTPMPSLAQLRKRVRALDFTDRHLPGAKSFNGGGPLLPHMGVSGPVPIVTPDTARHRNNEGEP